MITIVGARGWVFLALAAPLAGCGSAYQRFTGVMQTQEGQCGLGFDDAGHADATLTMRGPKVEFYPTTGVISLPGTADANGHVRAGTTTQGADKKPFVQAFEGDRQGSVINGRYASPHCRATVALTAH